MLIKKKIYQVYKKNQAEILYLVCMSCVCLLYTHSCINPILYALIREDLKVKICLFIYFLNRAKKKDYNLSYLKKYL